METAPMENRLEDRVERKGLETYGFADQVNYSVGLAAWRSLLVSLILPLSASCCCFLCVLFSFFFHPLVSLLVTLFPYYPVAFLPTSSFSLSVQLLVSPFSFFQLERASFFLLFFLILILVSFLDEKILRETLLKF